MEKKIIEIITQTHLTPKEQANKIWDLIYVMQRDMLNDMITQQEEIVSSPIRFNGVHIENIKNIFKNNGTEYQPPF